MVKSDRVVTGNGCLHILPKSRHSHISGLNLAEHTLPAEALVLRLKAGDAVSSLHGFACQLFALHACLQTTIMRVSISSASFRPTASILIDHWTFGACMAIQDLVCAHLAASHHCHVWGGWHCSLGGPA